MTKTDTQSGRVLVIGLNFSPEFTGIGKYTSEMTDWLCDNNFQCTMVTSFPYYPYWKVQAPYSNKFYKKEVAKNGKLDIYRCPLYVPKQPSGLKRLIHEFSFFLSAFFNIFFLLFKPGHDYIICVAPPFHLGFLATFYRFFKGGTLVYHIQDLQIEAAKELKMLKSDLAFKALFAMEKVIINRADYVSTISDGMMKKVSAKTNKTVLFFPNWVDTNFYYPLDTPHQIKPLWNYQSTDKVVLYSGSIGEKQGLDTIIDVAKNLEENRSIKFIICGTGPYKEKLVKKAKEAQLQNISFLPLQGQDSFNNLLNLADVHLILQKKNASDLVMPSKLTTILAVGGLALITAEPETTLFDVVSKHNIGVISKAENTMALTEAIYTCCTTDLSEIKLNGRAYAEKHLNRHNILTKMMGQVNGDKPTLKVLSPKLTLETVK